MSSIRRVRLFRNGSNQAVRIPRDLELPGDEALIRREGDRLILEPPVCYGTPWDCGARTIAELVERGRAGRCCVLADLDHLPTAGGDGDD